MTAATRLHPEAAQNVIQAVDQFYGQLDEVRTAYRADPKLTEALVGAQIALRKLVTELIQHG